MYLIDLTQRPHFLYECLPSLFPEGELGEVEVTLWEMYYRKKAQDNG